MNKLSLARTVALCTLLLAPVHAVEAGSLTLAWDPPTSGTTDGYRILYGVQSGVYGQAIDVGPVTAYTVEGVPDTQTFYVAVVAYNAYGISSPSSEIKIGGCSASPGSPTGLSATVQNTLVQLTWQPPAGDPPTGYYVEVGSATGLKNLANLYVTTTSLSGNASEGTYYVRVVGANECGAGAPSNEVTATVARKGKPGVPRNPKKQVFGTAVTLSWEPPASGDAPDTYFLEVKDGSGRVIADIDTGSPVTQVSGTVPPGIYHVRIRGANSGGHGPPTATITVVVTQ